MQFIVQGAKVALTQVPRIIKPVGRMAVRAVPVVVKPVAQFTRGVATGKAKYIPIAGTQGARTATITPFLRAGIQTRQVAKYVVKTAVVKGPVTTAKVVVGLARTSVRDAMSVYKVPIYIYQGVRAERIVLGRTSLGERAIDRYIAVSGRILDRFGLAPRATGTVAGLARLAIYGGLAREAMRGAENLNDLASYASSTAKNYQILADRILGNRMPAGSLPVVGVAPNVVESPVHHALPIPSGSGTRPVVPRNQSGAPIIFTQPVRR